MGAIIPMFASPNPDGSLRVAEPVSQAADSTKLFMKAKEFSERVGVPYGKVIDWIKQGMPVLPDGRSPYWIIVSAAEAWLRKRYSF